MNISNSKQGECPTCGHKRCDRCRQELVQQTTLDGSGREWVPGLLLCCQCDPDRLRSINVSNGEALK
jgi:hypothetical protein